VSQPVPPVALYQGSLAIARDLQRVLADGGVQAWTVPLPGGG
jgi:hypothetical protein